MNGVHGCAPLGSLPVDLRDSDAEAAFRTTLRAWLMDALPTLSSPPSPDDWPARRVHDTAWQRRLFEEGYAGIDWPAEYGGRGASPTEHLIFLEEIERAGAPELGVNYVGQNHAGPTIAAEGTDEQRAFHLRRILTGEHVWCQGFSEPSSGSDLASLRTRAIDDGDSYVLSGQKIWTSNGHVADYCEILVRTDPDVAKHKGITWLIMAMDSPGIDVRPLRTIAGSTEFCEMFLDEVRVPKTNRVGAENDGWRVGNVTLSFERGTGLVREVVRSVEIVRQLAELARRLPRDAGMAWDDVGTRRELGYVAADLDAIWALARRNIAVGMRTGSFGFSGSVLKARYGDVLHRMADVIMRVLDRSGLSLDDLGDLSTGRQLDHTFFAFMVSIAGGTTQIQRNIIGERVLGLPREPAWPSI